MRNILITGSTGVIGTHLVTELARLEYSVSLFDTRPFCQENLSGRKSWIWETNRNRDILCPDDVTESIENCMGVIHLAAVSRVGLGQQDPEHCWRVNVQGTRNLLQILTERKNPPWFLFASSREVYGQAQRLPVRETCPISPINVYGQSKAQAEREIWCAREANLPVAVLRLTNVYGSLYDHPDRLIPALTRNALCDKPLHLSGDSRIFDFVHINDVIDGILRVVIQLQAGERSLPPINLVSGHPTTLRNVVDLIHGNLKKPLSIQEIPHQDFDVGNFYGDGQLAQTLLGWSATITPKQGISDFLTKMKAHISTDQRN